jgi:adenylate kinase
MREHGFNESQIPPENQFEAKIELLNMAAIAIKNSGHEVIVDGHGLHKTAINVAAGQITDQLEPYFDQLADDDTTHTHVVLGRQFTDPAAAAELQRRITSRAEVPSKWDPSSMAESLAQLNASYALEASLRASGANVMRAVSTL